MAIKPIIPLQYKMVSHRDEDSVAANIGLEVLEWRLYEHICHHTCL